GMPHYPDWAVFPEYRGRWFFRERLNGVTVLRTPHTVPRASKVTAIGRVAMECLFSLGSMYWWSQMLLRSMRFDAVIAICPPMQTGLTARLYCLLRRVPMIFHIQDFQVDAAVRLGILKPGPFGRLLYVIENRLLKRADRVSTITPAMARRATEK